MEEEVTDKLRDKIEIYIHQTTHAIGFVPNKSCK